MRSGVAHLAEPLDLALPAPRSQPNGTDPDAHAATEPAAFAGQVVGIDLGTSCSAIARLEEDGTPRLLPTANGHELTDSVLAFCRDGSVRVGELLTDDVPSVDGPVVTAIKRHMGQADFRICHDGKQLSPELCSALILRKLVADASRFGDLAAVILTVPSYFYAPGRRATLAAGNLAGLPVVELLAEPIAAALAHLWRSGRVLPAVSGAGNSTTQAAEDRTLLVFDLGGGTFDVTLVQVLGGQMKVIATEGDNALGGIDWTGRLVEYVGEKFRRRHTADPRADPANLLRLTAACEAAKRELTTADRTLIEVHQNGIMLPLGVTRDEFQQMTADLLRRAQDCTEFLFESSGIDPQAVDEVLLVGGGSRLPSVAAMMTGICGRPVYTPPDPQRTVAEGAAIYAAAVAAGRGLADLVPPALRRRLDGVALQDVNAHSLGIALDDSRGRRNARSHILLPRNTPLPATVRRRFVTNLANPEGIALRLVEGEAPEVSACTIIGDWRITGLPPDLPAGSPVQVTFRLDRQRNVNVEAKELTRSTVAHVERVVADDTADSMIERELLAEFRLI